MTLEILICTYNDGIATAPNVLMPPMHNISYLVSWQQSDDYQAAELPAELASRDDVKVVMLHGTGVSANRNNAIDNATGDICLYADDDVTLLPHHVVHIVEYFEARPTLDIASFKYESQNYPKYYPSYSFDLRQRVKNYFVGAIEIAFRRQSVQGKVRFNTLFGQNAPVLNSAEEGVFVLDALEKVLNWFFFPYTIARHDHASTAERKAGDPATLMTDGAYIHLAYKDGTAPLRYVLLAWRACRNPLKFFTALRHVLQGVEYIKKNYIPALQ